MEKCTRSFFNIKLIIGVFIISIGILLLLKNMGYYIGFNLWDFWPLILIFMGLNHLFQPNENRHVFGGVIFLIIGSLFLLNNLDFYDFNFSLFWPIIIILIGIGLFRQGVNREKDDSNSQDNINLSFIMSGGEFKYSSKSIKGGNVFAVMGGCKLDLTQADFITDSITLDIFAFWGGVEIIVPSTWQVNLKGTPLLGGMENKTGYVDSGHTQPKLLIIKGMAIMGGVEVKN